MKNKEYYTISSTVLYKHREAGYFAAYIGRGYRNKHTYKVINPNGYNGFKIGDTFTPNEPEKHFEIIKTMV